MKKALQKYEMNTRFLLSFKVKMCAQMGKNFPSSQFLVVLS